jgi:hypothetical protein
MTERNFQTAVQYGSIVLGISIVFNIYLVMRYVEVYRDAVRVDAQLQQMVLRQQAVQGLLQDFAARANNDPQIAQIFRQPKTSNSAAAVPPNSKQP